MQANELKRGIGLLLATALALAATAQAQAAERSSAPVPAPYRSYAPTSPAGDTGFNGTDRAAIANLIQAYALAYDTFNADAWFDLFTPDAVFVVGVPGTAPITQSGDAFRNFWRDRLINFKTSGNQRRHLMSNITFLEQSDTAAHVSIVGLLTNVKAGKTFTVASSLNYEAWFEKVGSVWKIKRWQDFPDSSPEAASIP